MAKDFSSDIQSLHQEEANFQEFNFHLLFTHFQFELKLKDQ